MALYFNALPVWPKAPIAFLENLVPILLCLSGSVMYHSMMAHHWHYKKFLACDVSTCTQPWLAVESGQVFGVRATCPQPLCGL